MGLRSESDRPNKDDLSVSGNARCRAMLVFGSDWTVARLSPILGIHAASPPGLTIDGRNPHGWVPEQKISVEEAVRAYNLVVSVRRFGEKNKGTLERGNSRTIVCFSGCLSPHSWTRSEDTGCLYNRRRQSRVREVVSLRGTLISKHYSWRRRGLPPPFLVNNRHHN